MIRFGVIGTNWITDSFVNAVRQAEGAEVTAVYSRTEERAREFGAKHSISHIYTDLNAMAASRELDAVYIASPNSFHARQAIECMNAGKHVLCEKPIASNAYELKRMIEAAERSGVTLMEALKSTLLPNFTVIRDHIDQIGKVRRYTASFCQYSSRYDAYKAGTILNAFNPEFSNGALMDLGTYCLYPLVVLFGKPEQVHASALMLDSGVDGQGSLLLKYADMEAVVMYSKIADSSLPAEIQGEAGAIVFDKISQPANVRLRLRGQEEKILSKPQVENTMVYEVQEFVHLIQSGRQQSETNSWAASAAVMDIMDEARRQIGLVYPADSGMIG